VLQFALPSLKAYMEIIHYRSGELLRRTNASCISVVLRTCIAAVCLRKVHPRAAALVGMTHDLLLSSVSDFKINNFVLLWRLTP
jgi:hypothetical protein